MRISPAGRSQEHDPIDVLILGFSHWESEPDAVAFGSHGPGILVDTLSPASILTLYAAVLFPCLATANSVHNVTADDAGSLSLPYKRQLLGFRNPLVARH
jgi:hypothetical protein